MKKILSLTVLSAAILCGCNMPSADKSAVTLTELAQTLDLFKQAVKAQQEYFKKNKTYAASFEKLNVQFPDAVDTPCERPNPNLQCKKNEKFEFMVIGNKVGYMLTMNITGDAMHLANSGSASSKMPGNIIHCGATTDKGEKLCQFLGAVRNEALDYGGDFGNIKNYDIAL